jgi:Ran GTPase-activating protein (RanGAP) involved in mRNA processing and transport
MTRASIHKLIFLFSIFFLSQVSLNGHGYGQSLALAASSGPYISDGWADYGRYEEFSKQYRGEIDSVKLQVRKKDIHEFFNNPWLNSKVTRLQVWLIDYAEEILTQEEVAQFEKLQNLQFLSLQATKITNDVAKGLGRAIAKMPRLYNLDISRTFMRPESFRIMMAAIPHSFVTHLDISSQRWLEEDAGEVIAKLLKTKKLKELTAAFCEFGVVRATDIARGLPESNLEELDISNNPIGSAGLREFANQISKSTLKRFSIHEQGFSESSLQDFFERLPDMPLEGLYVGEVKTQGALFESLVKNLPLSQIKNLSLYKNELNDFEIEKIAAILPTTQIEQLKLRANHIADGGVLELFKMAPSSKLTRLDLEGNAVRDYGAREILRNILKTKIRYLNLAGNGTSEAMNNELKEFASKHPQIKIITE